MSRRGYDEVSGVMRVPRGKKLTRSRKDPSSFTSLLHGKGGITGQATFRPTGTSRRSSGRAFGRSLVLRTIVGLVVALVVVALLVAFAPIVQSLVEGMSVGAAIVGNAIVIGATLVLVLTLTVRLVKRAVRRRNARQAMIRESVEHGTAVPGRAAGFGTSHGGADWYNDPTQPEQLRYWDGARWTEHVARRSDAATAVPASAPVRENAQSSMSMTAAEWRSHFAAWVAGGAVDSNFWEMLVAAHIIDADPLTRDAQRQMRDLGSEIGVGEVRRMLEANPAWRDPTRIPEFMTSLAGVLAFLNQRGQVQGSARHHIGGAAGAPGHH